MVQFLRFVKSLDGKRERFPNAKILKLGCAFAKDHDTFHAIQKTDEQQTVIGLLPIAPELFLSENKQFLRLFPQLSYGIFSIAGPWLACAIREGVRL